MKYYYVYVTTDLRNLKQYVGDHSTINLEDNYLGGGIIIKNIIHKHGIIESRKILNKTILEFFDTKKEAFNAQEKWIIKFNTLAPNGYNISPKGGLGIKGCLSDESKLKISKANKGKQPWLGKHHTDETKKKIKENLNISGEKNPFFGKHHTNESKEKISFKLKNKKRPPFTEEHKNKIRNKRIGFVQSEETKQKIRNKLKGRIPWNKKLLTN